MTMSPQLRLTLASNIARRARQLAQADPDWIAGTFEANLIELDHLLEDLGAALDRHEGRIDADGTPTDRGEWVLVEPGETVVPKDSCEADHPTRHLQCWGAYGHEGPHWIGALGAAHILDDEWCSNCGQVKTAPGAPGICAAWHGENGVDA